MKIKNVKDKLIHIGTVALMPDQTTNISKEVAELPSIKCLIRMGYLKEVKETAKAKKSGKGEDNNGEAAGEAPEEKK